MDARRSAARRSGIRGLHRRAQPRQAARSCESPKKQSVRLQRAADERQRAGQIVHAVKNSDGNDQIEAGIRERQPIFVATDAIRLITGKETAAVGGCHLEPPAAELGRNVPIRAAKIERLTEVSLDAAQALQQLIGGSAMEIIGSDEAQRGALSAQAPQSSIEWSIHGGACGATAYEGQAAAMNAWAEVRGVARHIVDFALPPRCPGCGAVTEEQHRFCLECWQKLVFLGPPCCCRCGLPFEYEGGQDAECGDCLSNPPAYDWLRAAVAYGEVARSVALKLKYSGRPAVAETLAHFMRRHLSEIETGAILAPVPLHRWRIWKRGYNQSALIASALAKRTGLAVDLNLLARVKATPPLRGLGRRERALAVRGAFRAAPERTSGRTIILVDDVYTSGATANGCAKALKRAGAARVNIICWARVVATDN